MTDRSPRTDDDGRVVRFQPRGAAHGWHWPVRPSVRRPLRGDGPVDDLAKFERADDEDDYRHRMRMNALALLVTVVLVIAGIWLVNKLAELRKDQDCYLSGRRNCTPVVASPIERG